MKVLVYIILAIIIVSLVVLIIGLCLPKARTLSKETIYDASAEEVYNIVVNNHDWKYRTSLDNLRIIETDGDFEVWEEISAGNTIRFKTKEKIPYSFYSFEMESNLFTGYWQAEFKSLENKKTRFTATELIEYKNLFIRVLAYMFMNLDKYMETYQNDLRKKLEDTNKAENEK
jgi:hypothetical protein